MAASGDVRLTLVIALVTAVRSDRSFAVEIFEDLQIVADLKIFKDLQTVEDLHIFGDFMSDQQLHHGVIVLNLKDKNRDLFARSLEPLFASLALRIFDIATMGHGVSFDQLFYHSSPKVGVFVTNGAIESPEIEAKVLEPASQERLFNLKQAWLLMSDSKEVVDEVFRRLEVNVDTEVTLGIRHQNNVSVSFYDLFKICHSCGSPLELLPKGSWSQATGFSWLPEFLHETFVQRRRDFHGLQMRTSIALREKPESLTWTEYLNDEVGERQLDLMQRKTFHFLKDMQPMLNFSFDILFSMDWGQYVNGNWTGTVGHLVSGQAEATLCPIRYTLERVRVVQISPDLHTENIGFVFRHPRRNIIRNIFLEPFVEGVWWCVLGLVAGVVVLMRLLVGWETRGQQHLQQKRVKIQEYNHQESNLHKYNLNMSNHQKSNVHKSILHESKLQKSNLHKSIIHESNLNKSNILEINRHNPNFPKPTILKPSLTQSNLLQPNLLHPNSVDPNLPDPHQRQRVDCVTSTTPPKRLPPPPTSALENRWDFAVLTVLAATLMQGPSPDAFNSMSSRTLIVTICLFSVMLLQFYGAFIVGSLLADVPRTITNLHALYNSSLEIGMEDIAYNYELFINTTNQMAKDIYVHRICKGSTRRRGDHIMSMQDGLDWVGRGGFAFHISIDRAYRILKYQLDDRELCDLQEINMEPPFTTGVALRRGTPFREHFAFTILHFRAHGLLQHLEQQWGEKRIDCALVRSTEVEVDLEHFLPAMAFLATAMLLSLAVLLLELLAFNCRQHRLAQARGRGMRK